MSSKKKKADTTRYQIKAKYLELQHHSQSDWLGTKRAGELWAESLPRQLCRFVKSCRETVASK